jgi:hypothetical protein
MNGTKKLNFRIDLSHLFMFENREALGGHWDGMITVRGVKLDLAPSFVFRSDALRQPDAVGLCAR